MLETEKILVVCPGCHKRLRVKPALAGKRVRCPNTACAKTIAVPARQDDEDVDDATVAVGSKRIWLWSGAGVVAVSAAAFAVWFFLLRGPGTTSTPIAGGDPPVVNPSGDPAVKPVIDPIVKPVVDNNDGQGKPSSMAPKGGLWEGEFISNGKGHRLRLWISSDGKTVERGNCVAELDGGATISNTPLLLSPAPIADSRFKAKYVDNKNYHFHGAFKSATAVEGDAALSFIVGAAGVVRLTGTWSAKHKGDAVAPAIGANLTKEKILGKWKGKFDNGTIDIEFNDKLAVVSIFFQGGGFGIGSVGYEVDDKKNEVRVSMAVAKPINNNALTLVGKIMFGLNTYNIPETRLERATTQEAAPPIAAQPKKPDAKSNAAADAPETPRKKNVSESKVWSVKVVKASRGFIENWAYLDVEFKALTAEEGSIGERFVPYKNSFVAMGLPTEPYLFMIDLGNIADYTRKIGGAPAPEKVLAKPSRVFFSGAAELELPDGKRVRPYLTSMPKGLLEYTPSNTETIYGFASTRAVGGANPDVLRFIVERGGSTLAVVQPGRTISSKLSYDNVPKDIRTVKLHFADCPAIEVSID